MIDQTLDLLLLIEKAKKAAQKMGDVEIAYQLYRVELNVRCGIPESICWACFQDLPEEKPEPEENPEEHYPSARDFSDHPPVYSGFDL